MRENRISENLILIIWTLSLVATIGSLFFSEILGYTPCDLCWVQRIFMYPLVIIYGMAAVKKDARYAASGIILSSLGLLVSIYHYSLQKLPALQAAGGFCKTVSCNLEYVNYFGFITIPFLAGVAFLSITVLHIVMLKLK